ncbi:MAG: tetratricopeptide repeat protein [Bryobacter sp.]|nr:tetratricopeptide repeat protein [Bryobacter sp.]
MCFLAVLMFAGLLEEGLRLSEAGRWAEAREKFAAATQAEPSNGLAWKALGVASGRLNDLAAAEEAFREGCQQAPKTPDLCYFHARSLYTMNRFIPAISALKAQLPTDPQPARIWLALGQAQEAASQPKEAELSFQSALKLQPRSPDARHRFAVFLYRVGRLAEAQTELEAALAADPKYAPAHAELGRVYYQQGKLPQAIQHLEASAASIEWAGLLLEKARRRLRLTAPPAAAAGP